MKRGLVILPNAFEVFEAAAFIDVLGWANEYGDAPIETVTAGTDEEITRTFGVLKVRPKALLVDIDAVDFDAVDIDAVDFDAVDFDAVDVDTVAIAGGFETKGFFEDASSIVTEDNKTR